jgi:hypothetical protein
LLCCAAPRLFRPAVTHARISQQPVREATGHASHGQICIAAWLIATLTISGSSLMVLTSPACPSPLRPSLLWCSSAGRCTAINFAAGFCAASVAVHKHPESNRRFVAGATGPTQDAERSVENPASVHCSTYDEVHRRATSGDWSGTRVESAWTCSLAETIDTLTRLRCLRLRSS